MKQHIKVYMDYFGYCKDDFKPCEVCGNPLTDVHHIDCKGMGGSKLKDFIENLMGLCRKCHTTYGDKKQFMDFLQTKHKIFMEFNGKPIR
jgi:uncharacterized protein with PIN domain